MPFAQPTNDPRLPVLFNVTRSVGSGGANERNDVKLVQYLLREIYKATTLPSPPGTMVMDGFYGPITQRWISRFQQDLVTLGWPVFADGKVNRAKSGFSSVSHTIYTITAMNLVLQSGNPGALAATPQVVPMTPLNQVPSEYVDPPVQIPASGGI